MQPFEAREARKLIDFIVNHLEREHGHGDLVLRIQTRSGADRVGHIVEWDGESSPHGVLLNDGGKQIRYDEMIWIGIGFGL